MTDIDQDMIEKEQKRITYTKGIFLSLFVTILAFIVTTSISRPNGDPFDSLRVTLAGGDQGANLYQPFFLGFIILMAIQVVLIFFVQVRYYVDLPYDFDMSQYQSKNN